MRRLVSGTLLAGEGLVASSLNSFECPLFFCCVPRERGGGGEGGFIDPHKENLFARHPYAK